MHTCAIDLEALSKTYRQRNWQPIRAVQDLSLYVSPGQVYGFLGPNGAGKTTTIKMICGLVRPSAGSARVGKWDVWRSRAAAMRRIGVVLEGTRDVRWSISAWDSLLYFGYLKGKWGKRLAARAEQLLRELDLWDRQCGLVRNFWRGMQQKAAVACALVANPPIVLLDEPTLGLDVRAARAVEGVVQRLAREMGKTVVLTTHQLDMAQEFCDHVAIISKGRLIADRRVPQLLGRFTEEYYLIRVEGTLPAAAGPGFDGLAVTQESRDTLLSGPIADQDALDAILDRLYGLGLPLVSVSRTEPDLGDVFLGLLDANRRSSS